MSDTEFMLLDRDYNRRTRNQFLVKVLVIGFAFILVFVMTSLLLSSSSPQLKRPKFVGNCSVQYDYDYNLLTLRWPTSVCADQSCVKYPTDRWLIHGLWPTFANHSWPQYCCFNRKFDPKNLDPIESELLVNWPNLETGRTTDSLWRHEWERHGTCTHTKQIDYFNNTLHFNQLVPIYEWLKDGNITPTDDKTYDLQTIEKVLSNKLNHKVVIKCLTDSKTKRLNVVEISICIKHNTSQVIDCSESSNSCKNGFYYPKPKSV